MAAQTSPVVPPPLLDSYTPAAVAPGTPDGSYTLSGFDTINYGTLGINFRFPLLKVGGRGSVSSVMMPDFTLGAQWMVFDAPYITCQYVGMNQPCAQSVTWSYHPTSNTGWAAGVPPMYGAPRMVLREGAWQCNSNGNGQYWAQNTLSRLTFIGSDGTEMALIDKKTGGAQQSYSLAAPIFDRGSVWVTRDGTSAVFTASSDILDSVATAGNCSTTPQGVSGTLVTKDGTRYIFSNGYATSVSDRNGNTISYAYSSQTGQLTGITDPLGRFYGVQLGLTDTATGRIYDQLSYPSSWGNTRYIKIFYDSLGHVLRSDQSLKDMSALWPGMLPANQVPYGVWGGAGGYVSQIVLADGSSYSFQRDSYGNVAQVQLPTGGIVQYDWAGQSSAAASTSSATSIQLRCYLTQRREYANSGSTRTRVTNFSLPSVADDYDGNGNLQSHVVHSVITAGWIPAVWAAVGYDDPTVGQEPTTQYYDRDGTTLLRQINRTYQERSCSGDPTCWWLNTTASYGRPPHDYLLWQETTSEGALSKQEVTLYDQYNNENSHIESDWGSGASGGSVLRKTVTTYNTGASYINANILNLPTDVQILDASGARWAETGYGYDETAASTETNPILNNNSPAGPRGNRTTITECVNLASCSPEKTTYTFDVAGNVRTITDANSHTATLFYNDNYGDGNDGRNTYAHVTAVNYPPANVSAAAQSASWQYDFGTGKPIYANDVNGVTTGYSYSDPLDRLTQIYRAIGKAGVQSQTNISYTAYSATSGTPAAVDVYDDQTGFVDEALHKRTVYDGLGREVENDQFVGGGSYIQVLKTYDAMGRVATTSTPAVPGSGFSQSWLTSYAPYDGLGRILKVTTLADNATTTTTYSSNQTTVKDQAGKQRASWSDGLGRLIQVEEAPTSDQFYTTYSYTPLNNLVCVNQYNVGAVTANPQIYSCDPTKLHSRTFSYNGFAQLVTATNPEAGTISYAYDNVGNLLKKTDARTVITCFGTLSGSACSSGYDGLNRPTVKNYSDGTPPVTYSYDTATNGVGRLAQVRNSVSTTNFLAYDALGRVTNSSQVTGGVTYNFPSYQYNLAGALTSEALPSGRTFSTGYDAANRPIWMSGSFGGVNTPYIGTQGNSNTYTQYWPSGEPWFFIRGNNVWHAASLNGRLQVVESYESVNNQDTPAAMLFMACPGWGFSNNSNWGTYNDCPQVATGTDNGNMVAYDEYLGGPGYGAKTHFSQTFSYDDENRLKAASDTGGWARNFAYDAWGNMAVTLNSGVALNVNTPTSLGLFNANNQRTDQSYDAAGNLKAVQPGLALTYDAENRQMSAGGYSYGYDGNGRRVSKTGGGVSTVYVYDAAGQLAEEAPLGSGSWKKDYVRIGGGGMLVAEEYSGVVSASPPCTTCYLSYDHLGSVRLVTDQNANVISRHDYLPFGEEIAAGSAGRNGVPWAGADAVTQRFTGKVRDGESGLDYFGARYYGGALGRFTAVDPIWIKADRMLDPQRLNLYVYGRSNPLRFLDPTGMDVSIGTCGAGMTTSMCEAAVTNGLTKEDRSHVHFVKGDGKNGFANGQDGVRVDADYKSKSLNFTTLQSLANDHSALAKIDIFAANDTYSFRADFNFPSTGLATHSSRASDFAGYTFFQFRGKDENGILYSTGNFTEVVVNGEDQSSDITSTIYHKLQHVFLGDFGRSAPKSKHGIPEVERRIKAAEAEADKNASQ